MRNGPLVVLGGADSDTPPGTPSSLPADADAFVVEGLVRRDIGSDLQVDALEVMFLVDEGSPASPAESASADVFAVEGLVRRDAGSDLIVDALESLVMVRDSASGPVDGEARAEAFVAEGLVRRDVGTDLQVDAVELQILAEFLEQEEIDVDFPPLPEDGTPIPVIANWAPGVRVTSAYLTVSGVSRVTGSSERDCQRLRPSRSIEVTWSLPGARERESLELYAYMEDLTDQQAWFPLYCDMICLEAGGGSSEVALWSSTDENLANDQLSYALLGNETSFSVPNGKMATRRFYTNVSVVIFGTDAVGRPVPGAFYFRRLVEVDREAGVFTTNEILAPAPSIMSQVSSWAMMPLIYCEEGTSPSVAHHYEPGAGFSVSVSVVEDLDAFAIPPSETPRDDLPRYLISPDRGGRVESRLTRAVERKVDGRFGYTQTFENRYRLEQDFTLVLDRGGYYDFLQTFDGARGRWLPFVLMGFDVAGRFAGAGGKIVVVEPDGDFAEFRQRVLEAGYLGVCVNDAWAIGEVDDVVESGGKWVATIDVELPILPLGTPAKVLTARRCHFATDSVQESWVGLDGVTLRFSTIEDLDPGDVTVE